ncbi:equilibrative nucleoside transporter 4 [Electrophorus electricus]|uniref:equilibrative nucleoside transporter 4 n=1 Tax=Electrophorus electricus TaxID=8005 RepID=UPI0015D02D74|nr:equilibrative nucleoside transporter 4 [Electrophorus electricus]
MHSEEWSRLGQRGEKNPTSTLSFSGLPDEDRCERRSAHVTRDSELVPDDRYHGIYFAMLLAGVGFLLPYNSFIMDVDYLHRKFTGSPIVFDMSLTYILVALGAVILNNALVERLSLHTRISAGYLFALGPLVFVSVFDVWLELFNSRQSYAITLTAVATVAFGCTVQQSSFYGYTGMLPKRYTQGVMTGESTAGVIVSLSRIFTKLLVENEKNNTIIFFLFSVSMETLCLLLHMLVWRSRFVRYHTGRVQHGDAWVKGQIAAPAAQQRGGYRIHRDISTEDEDGPLTSPPAEADASNPFNGCHGDGTYVRFDVPKPKTKRTWVTVKDAALRRCAVARVLWPYMLSICVTYFVTLCLFPGLESELRNEALGEWLPILTMGLFNMADFVGKILAACPYEWGGTQLVSCTCVRVLFLPLFVMCVSPTRHPLLAHPAWPCALSVLLGISNGYLGSVPMIQAVGRVPPQQRELAGNTMTVSYMAGLMLGSAVSYSTFGLTSHTPPAHSSNTTLSLHTYMPRF